MSNQSENSDADSHVKILSVNEGVKFTENVEQNKKQNKDFIICELCKTTYNNETNYEYHLKTVEHKKKVNQNNKLKINTYEKTTPNTVPPQAYEIASRKLGKNIFSILANHKDSE